MSDIWVPGFTRVNGVKSGGTYRENAPYRFALHTTETSYGNARRLAETHPNSPHLWVDPSTREKYQVIPLNRSAYALAHPSGTIETNHMRAIQVEILGRAAETHTWPTSWYDWLATDVVGPVCELMSIDWKQHPRFYGANEGIVLASTSSPIRMNNTQWRNFNGVCGHQHVPANSHWDPGKFNYERIKTVLNDNQEDGFLSALSDNEQKDLYNRMKRVDGETSDILENQVNTVALLADIKNSGGDSASCDCGGSGSAAIIRVQGTENVWYGLVGNKMLKMTDINDARTFKQVFGITANSTEVSRPFFNLLNGLYRK